MTHVCFQFTGARRAIWTLLIAALFLGGLSPDAQFDLTVGPAPGVVLAQVVESDPDEFKLKELSFVFMLAILFIACRQSGLGDTRRVMRASRFLLPVLPFKLHSTYRI